MSLGGGSAGFSLREFALTTADEAREAARAAAPRLVQRAGYPFFSTNAFTSGGRAISSSFTVSHSQLVSVITNCWPP